jgi:hypothetical protein
MKKYIYSPSHDGLVERPVISESFNALAYKITAKYGLAPNDPIDWLYALEDMYNEGFKGGLQLQRSSSNQ